MKDELIRLAEQVGIEISDEQGKSFIKYMDALLAFNAHTNLTAITNPREILEKHFVDSLLILKACTLPYGGSLLDVGSGAGFPGIPLLIMRPDLSVTLMDSAAKRVKFLTQVISLLSLDAKVIQLRAEEAGRKPEYRESFEVVTARALAAMRKLSEYCLPLCRVGGIFAAMKGSHADEELRDAENTITVLGGKIEGIWAGQLDDGASRSIVVIRKEECTPEKYPRRESAIDKKPIEA